MSEGRQATCGPWDKAQQRYEDGCKSDAPSCVGRETTGDCRGCEGTGLVWVYEDGDEEIPCPLCDGTGDSRG